LVFDSQQLKNGAKGMLETMQIFSKSGFFKEWSGSFTCFFLMDGFLLNWFMLNWRTKVDLPHLSWRTRIEI
jgi:hypothetical protein